MSFLWTAFAFVLTGVSAVILIPIGLPFFALHLLGFKNFARFAIYHIAQGWARMIVAYTGCRLTVRGRENIPKTGGFCVISNHLGIFDIVLHLAYVGRPFGFMAKKELALIPFINIWILLLGGHYIDRSNPRKAIKAIASGVRHITEGGGMIIFPEGTRSKGRGLLPFHAGSFKLATASAAPIVPAALTGSYDVFEKNMRIRRVDVTVTYGPVIDTSSLSAEERRRNLSDKVHSVISSMLSTEA
jgi:1-acyl-sn-glycerol-3-phosphate acyltransferase